MNSIDKAKNRLRSENFYVTEPRESVLELLFNQEEFPRTPKQIYKNLPNQDIDRSSVYRTINLFLELGILVQVQFRDNVKHLELSEDFGGSHHHHLVCEQCGETIEFQECGIKNVQRLAEIKHEFQVQDHQMEFFGLCRSCQEEAA
jgi:Fur family ferric uptake transcriptional regulator